MFREGKDDDQFYTKNNMLEFRARYQKRIANLRENIRTSGAVKLVYNRCSESRIDPMNLRSCYNDDEDNELKLNEESSEIAWAFRGTYPGSHSIHVVPVAFDAPEGFVFL